MTDKRLAILTRLFREVETKTNEGVLEFQFVVNGLQTISKGKEVSTVLYAPGITGVLAFRHSLSVESSAEVTLEFENSMRRNAGVRGYSMGVRPGPSFEIPVQPGTAGGEGAILETTRRAILFDFVRELLNEPITKECSFERKLFEQELSFSLPQVLKILDSGLPHANKKKSRIFFIHNSKGEVGPVSISSAHSQLFSRDWDGAYSYAEGTNVIIRNTPKHFQPK